MITVQQLYKSLFFIVLYCLVGNVAAQESDLYLYVNSEKNLNIRSDDKLDSPVLISIAPKDSVKLLYDSGVNTHRIAGKDGKMVIVQHGNTIGYCFDGFLSRNKIETPKVEVKQEKSITKVKISDEERDAKLAEYQSFVDQKKKDLAEINTEKFVGKPYGESEELMEEPVEEQKIEELSLEEQLEKLEYSGDNKELEVGGESIDIEYLKEKNMDDFLFATEKINQIIEGMQVPEDSTLIKLKEADLSQIKLPDADSTDNFDSYRAKMKDTPELQKLLKLIPANQDYSSSQNVLIIPTTNIDDAFEIVKVMFDLPEGLYIPATKIMSRTVIENPNKRGDCWFDQLVISPDAEGRVKELTYNLRGKLESYSLFMIRTNRTIKVHYKSYK